MTKAPVLYVEDDEDDALIMQAGFQGAKLPHPLRVLTDGQQAIDYLAGNGEFADRSKNPRPCLVLLDLKLPVRSGFEVLEWVRQQPHFHSLPVIVFTSSDHEADRDRAMQVGANAFITKSSDMSELGSLVRSVKDRWLAAP